MEVDRECSPVELDVSFKSNALVAKAVVTPSSPLLDDNYTQPRNRNLKRATEFVSPLKKIDERLTRAGSSFHGSDCSSSSDKARKQLRVKDFVYDDVRVGDSGSLPCSGAVSDFARNVVDDSLSGPVLDQDGGIGRSDGPLSFRLRKKRKVMNLSSHASNSQLTEKDDKPINGENFKNSPTAPIQGAISFPSLQELIVSKVDASPQAIVSEKDGPEFDTLMPCQHDNEKIVAALSSPLSDMSNPSLHNINSFGDDPTENKTLAAWKESSIHDDQVNDLNQQPSQNEVSWNLENDTQKVSTDVKVSLGGTGISASSGQDQVEIQKCPTRTYASFDAANITYSLCNVSVKMQKTSTGAGMNSLDPGLDEVITIFNENGDVQGSIDDGSRKEEKTQLLEGTINANCCNLSTGTFSIPNGSLTTTQAKEITSESCIVGDTGKQTCFNKTWKFPVDGSTESPNAAVIAEDNANLSSDKSYIPVAKRNTKGLEIPFNLSTPSETHENVVDALLNVGATPSSSLKESSFEKDVAIEMEKLISAAVQTPSPDHRVPSTDDVTYLLPKDDLPPSSNIFSACADGIGAFVTDSNDKSVESMPDTVTDIVSSQKVSSFSGSHMLISKSTDQMISNSSIPKNDENICEESVFKDHALLNCPESLVENSRTSTKKSHLEETDLLANTKTSSSASQGSSVTTQGFNMKLHGSNFPTKKMSSASAVPRVFAGRSSPVFTSSRINTPANHITKPRTWHRSTSNPASSVTKSSSIFVPLPPKQVGMGQNSYIRSGNTLIRKGAPVTAISNVYPASTACVYRSNSSGPIETTNNAGSGSEVHSTFSRTGGSSAPVVRPKTPPLLGSTKSPDCTTLYSRDLSSLPLEHLTMKGSYEEVASPVEGNSAAPNVSEYHKSSEGLEDQNGTPSNSEIQKTLDEGTAGKKIHYVKWKSNQLVAASSSDQSVQDLDKPKVSSSDGYYKRRKNQLIRTLVGHDSVNTDVQSASQISVKRQSGKVAGISKKYKYLRFSSVWTLNSQLLGKDGISLRQKLRPHLFPWKRSRYWGNVMNISTSIPRDSPLSSISRKLLLSRKREMIYTRSRHGFSLRMSKLLSVGGSSLKWSKSIESNSKRANEEATLAVAAAEKKKREQHGTSCATAEIKRSDMSRDRIYRIGLVRYKMDPSRRTLQRISDEEPSTSIHSKEEVRRSYVPKRLLIGHDEYLRIGNGNQLVRNPKRRTRIFANEKVRWSLHTARSRLARKKKYCQFFTRFGKCNKDDGKCPYIHDSTKIAVCTKFLNGLCSNHDCKLTHKVIPERMQDCSYFLQGLCSNEHCPYRHVNVNPAASICEGFLKGYCADGNECPKKHTYACPVFEATGACSQGAKCKLHHRKNRNMGLKRKQQHSMEQHQKNARGRYFGSIRDGEAMPISEKHHLEDVLCQEAKFAEYIGLDFSSEEAEYAISEQRTTLTRYPSDLGAADFDDLTKPIGLMNKIVFDLPSEVDLALS